MTSLLSKSCQVAFSALRYHLNAFKQQMNISRENTILPSQLSFNANNELLQTIISTANIVASGDTKTFNNTQSLLLTLFEKIRLSKSDSKPSTHYGYIPLPLSASSIFPTQISNVPPEKVYAELWETFVKELENIPVSHRQKWDLWLDHFDSICQCFTSNMPSITTSGVNPEVSLYDHSKTTAALATALWRWHEENQLTGHDQAVKLADRSASWDEQKFLLIQGDFFGIQDFIFSGGSDSNKQAAKLLRGRSFQVSLFTELAALKVLQACELPSTSQMMNAAGKFLIIAPNTEKAVSYTHLTLPTILLV